MERPTFRGSLEMIDWTDDVDNLPPSAVELPSSAGHGRRTAASASHLWLSLDNYAPAT